MISPMTPASNTAESNQAMNPYMMGALAMMPSIGGNIGKMLGGQSQQGNDNGMMQVLLPYLMQMRQQPSGMPQMLPTGPMPPMQGF